MLQDVLKDTRLSLNLKQADVAEYVGITTQTYMKWENGKNEPTVDVNIVAMMGCY